MKRRAVRLASCLLFAVALGAAGVVWMQAEQTARAERLGAREFDRFAASAQTALAETQGALQATVAVGQSEEFWLDKAARLVERVRTDIADLKQRASSPDALNDLDAASADVDALVDVARRAARLHAAEQRTQASLLVFGEGLERATAAADRIRAARDLQAHDTDLAAEARRRAELYSAAGLAIGCLLVVALLAASGRASEHVAAEVVAGPEGLALDLHARPATETVEAPAEQVPVASPPEPPMAETPLAAIPPRDRRKAPELRAAADLCTDFARLLDSQELPALLERAARLIDASGIIVWVADPRTSELRPALAHGYPAKALERMSSLPHTADNATAAAYRHTELQVVKTNGMSPGAIAVPLLNASGCIGVVSAEVRHGRESSESARALARIVAAQLSAVLTVAPAQEVGVPRDSETAVG